MSEAQPRGELVVADREQADSSGNLNRFGELLKELDRLGAEAQPSATERATLEEIAVVAKAKGLLPAANGGRQLARSSLKTQERQFMVYELIVRGVQIQQIATTLGLNPRTIRRDIEAEEARRSKDFFPQRDRMIALGLARYTRVIQRADEKAYTKDATGLELTQVLRAQERIDKLLGLEHESARRRDGDQRPRGEFEDRLLDIARGLDRTEIFAILGARYGTSLARPALRSDAGGEATAEDS